MTFICFLLIEEDENASLSFFSPVIVSYQFPLFFSVSLFFSLPKWIPLWDCWYFRSFNYDVCVEFGREGEEKKGYIAIELY